MEGACSTGQIFGNVLKLALLGFLVVALAGPIAVVLGLALVGFLAWSFLAFLGGKRLIGLGDRAKAVAGGVGRAMPRGVQLAGRGVGAVVRGAPPLAFRGARRVAGVVPPLAAGAGRGVLHAGRWVGSKTRGFVRTTNIGRICLETISGAALGGALGGVASAQWRDPEVLVFSGIFGGAVVGFLVATGGAPLAAWRRRHSQSVAGL